MKNSLDKTYKNHGRTLGWGAGPEADWKVMFTLFLILCLGIILAHYYIYNSMGERYGGEPESLSVPIDKDALRRTANYYEERKVEFESVRKTLEILPDPSV